MRNTAISEIINCKDLRQTLLSLKSERRRRKREGEIEREKKEADDKCDRDKPPERTVVRIGRRNQTSGLKRRRNRGNDPYLL